MLVPEGAGVGLGTAGTPGRGLPGGIIGTPGGNPGGCIGRGGIPIGMGIIPGRGGIPMGGGIMIPGGQAQRTTPPRLSFSHSLSLPLSLSLSLSLSYQEALHQVELTVLELCHASDPSCRLVKR